MNTWLAEIYGTAGADDLEKTAQAHLLSKLAEEEGIDLSQFSPEELQALANEVLMANGGALPQQGAQAPLAPQQSMIAPAQPQFAAPQQAAPQAAPQAPAPMQAAPADPMAMQKEAEAKFEEADMLGRVMAHAYTQELEKIASAKTAGLKEHAGKALGHAKAMGHKAVGHVKGHKGAYGAGAGGAAAGYAAGRMHKRASAFEKLAEEHAADILSAVGIDPSTGGQAQDPNAGMAQQPQAAVAPQQQQMAPEAPADPQQDFQQALDSRALEILSANGYDVNAIVAALTGQQ